MGRQPGQDGGTGSEPGPIPGEPGDTSAPGPASSHDDSRDPHLSGFARDGRWDACAPSAALAVALEAASGPQWRCAGATRDEMFGVLRQWQALEAWVAAGKLGVLRALVREDDEPLPGGGYQGDLPVGWTKSLTYEVAAALSITVVSAENLLWLAWDLQGRLPGIGALLAAGSLTYGKAKAVTEALRQLSPEDAAKAEAMLVPDLAGKTYGQAQKQAVQAAITVDPEWASRRREDAEQNRGRVLMFREESGAAGLSGRDMPTDQTLAAHAKVCARAQEYKDSGAFSDDVRMDQYRVAAYLDLINGITADARIAAGQLVTVSADTAGEEPTGTADPEPAPSGPGGPSAPAAPPGLTSPPRLADLVIPLATLLGLADRPGESLALGALDPGLCRSLAASAVASPHSKLCVTVVDQDGIAIGHGCVQPSRTRRSGSAAQTHPTALPARVNLTITAARLAGLASQSPSTGPPGNSRWWFTGDPASGPPGGFGIWTLALPDGRSLVVALEPVATFGCDHRHESHAYQPNDTLRHLVQIRDYTCTFPTCSRHARECDFEHALPYDQGGRTCCCNAGARSRQCHRVKQSPGWNVAQPRPGWHQWQTPAGRTYMQAPKRYPA